MPNSSSVRPIDHCVLPVGSLDLARKRLQALGFTVAPDGIHPFGTRNACVYFADDTFLEPLVVDDAEKAEEEAKKENVFVARDRTYRHLAGENGFSALVMATDDAAADHEAFVAADLSAGPMLNFSRDYIDAEGKNAKVTFRLAFAVDPLAPQPYFFTCQRIDAPATDRGALAEHSNAVTGTAGVIAVADDPSAFDRLMETLSGAKGKADGHSGLEFDPGDSAVSIMTPQRFADVLGGKPPHGAGLNLAAISFRSASLDKTRNLLKASDIAFGETPAGLVVAPTTGQGAYFIFQGST